MAAKGRSRLDVVMVQRGLCGSRSEAQEAIEAGQVLVQGSVATSASRQVAPEEAVVLQAPPRRFVSRGGEKLLGGLEWFGVEVEGFHAIDAGASTGGFTDVLLQRGAARVYAVDVGYGQLDHRLRSDPRVVVRERTNVRSLDVAALGEDFTPVDLIVADVSFISLRLVLPALVALAREDCGQALVLVKPQFEADRSAVSAGKGVIRDPELWRSALMQVAHCVTSLGWTVAGATVSPLHGPKGNTEFVLWAGAGLEAAAESWIDLALDQGRAMAEDR